MIYVGNKMKHKKIPHNSSKDRIEKSQKEAKLIPLAHTHD